MPLLCRLADGEAKSNETLHVIKQLERIVSYIIQKLYSTRGRRESLTYAKLMAVARYESHHRPPKSGICENLQRHELLVSRLVPFLGS